MSRFNLLDEPWISVIVDEKGHNKLVSITDVFKHASEYKALAGDMKIQDFALLRILLAVLHTVFLGTIFREILVNLIQMKIMNMISIKKQ